MKWHEKNQNCWSSCLAAVSLTEMSLYFNNLCCWESKIVFPYVLSYDRDLQIDRDMNSQVTAVG